MRYAEWIQRLQRLKPHGGTAPHKPLLLLAILEMAEQDGTLPATLRLTPELAYRFRQFEHVVAHRRRQKLDVRMPFHHLQTAHVWTPQTQDGSVSPHRSVTVQVELDPAFHESCLDPDFREAARRVLISRYFEPQEQVLLSGLVGLPLSVDAPLDEGRTTSADEPLFKAVREARFRLNVVPAYNYTCALTGYRVTTIDRGSIVDAAHIEQFNTSRNNDLRNGLALCKNAHWAFDAGLWSIDDEYRVLVAEDAFEEEAPHQTPLTQFAGRRLALPANPEHWPEPRYLAAHRRRHHF